MYVDNKLHIKDDKFRRSLTVRDMQIVTFTTDKLHTINFAALRRTASAILVLIVVLLLLLLFIYLFIYFIFFIPQFVCEMYVLVGLKL